MKCVVPSTSVRNKYLKSLPIGTVFKDPRNNHVYEIQERKINSSFSKVAIPYFGQNEPIEIDVPEKLMKMENPVRANINQSLKERIAELEETISQLRAKSEEGVKQSLFAQIKQLMDGNDEYETEKEMFSLGKNIIFYAKKNGDNNARESIERQKKDIWTDPTFLDELTRNQPAIQKRLLKHLTNDASNQKVVEMRRRSHKS